MRFRLRTKIFLGFGVLIALLLGVAAFGSYGLSTVGDEIARMDNMTRNLRRTEQIVLRMEQIRRALTRYLVDADKDSVVEVARAEATTAALLTEAARATLSDRRRDLFTTGAEKLRELTPKRERFIALIDAGLAGRERLFATGTALESALGALEQAVAAHDDQPERHAASAAEVAILSTRLAGLSFLATPTSDLAAGFAKQADAGVASLAGLESVASPQVKAMLPALRTALDAHVAAFGATSAALLEGRALYLGDIRPSIKDLQGIVEKAQESLSTAVDDTNRTAASVAANTLVEQIVLSGAGAAVGILAGLLIARAVIRPVHGMTHAMTRLAAGDTRAEVPSRDNTDEIGEMARAVVVFREQAIENARLAAEKAAQQAAKDRRQAAMDGHIQDFGSSVSGVMDGFMASADAMRGAASVVADGARHTRSSTSRTVEGATLSSRDLGSVAAAAEELAASINEISQQVGQVSRSVSTAVDRAADTDAKVAGLSEAADRIGEVVRLITDIAGQTNLLALNATIEAARAGEAGRGFAVVAGEVKALAAQTARATEQIGSQILAIRAATQEAVDAVREVGSAIGHVQTIAGAIAGAVEAQASATREITESVHTVTATTAAAVGAMREVLGIAESTDAGSVAALEAAAEVGRTAATLRTEVTDFLAALTGGDDDDRRFYERIDATGLRATLQIAGHPIAEVAVRDIARGGISLLYQREAPIGTDAEIALPGGGTVRARVARRTSDTTGFAFRQDANSLTTIERTLELVRGNTVVSRAA